MPSKIAVASVTAEPVAPSICATLASIEVGEAHIHRSAAHGFFPVQQIEMISNVLTAARNGLKSLLTHMPAHDPNAAKINDLIERIG